MSHNLRLNLTIIFCIGMLGLVLPTSLITNTESEMLSVDNKPRAALDTNEVEIENDNDLFVYSNGGGDGSATTPYIFENWNTDVTQNYSYGVILRDISKYVILRNITVFSSNPNNLISGFYFDNCSHIQIESCTLINSEFSYGFSAHDSNEIKILGCRIIDLKFKLVTLTGFQLVNCNNSIVANNYQNTVKEAANSISSFDISDSDNVIVRNNQIFVGPTTAYTGIYAGGSEYLTIENNSFQGYSTGDTFCGMNVKNCHYATIQNNRIEHQSANIIYAIDMGNCNNSRVENNKINNLTSRIYGYGINIMNIENSIFSKNVITNFSFGLDPTYGISLYECTKNRIYHNYIAGGEIPIMSTTGTNYLYSFDYWLPSGTTRAIGNYYWNYTGSDTNGDYIGDSFYNSSNCYDPFPLLSGGFDNDGDQLYNAQEMSIFHTDPNKADTDGDGWTDSQELNEYGTNPLKKDSDNDGFLDSIDTLPLTSNLPQENTTIIVMNNNAVNSTATSNQSNSQSNTQSSGDTALNQTNTANEIPWDAISQDIRTIGIIAVGIIGALVIIIVVSFQKLAKQGNMTKLLSKKDEK